MTENMSIISFDENLVSGFWGEGASIEGVELAARKPSTRGNVAPPTPWLQPGHYRYRGKRESIAPTTNPWRDKGGKRHPAINPPKSKEPRWKKAPKGSLA